MSGTRPTPVEQHLGDRLASFVDGELGHDARDRVLAHLATCPRCKAEADEQRRVKSAFAQAEPPPLSDSFLARLQGLPGGGLSAGPVFESSGDAFGYAAALPGGPETGFRIHPVVRPEGERPAVRGRRRFAFAAAGAVSLAAIALGGVSTITAPVDGGDARGPSSNNVTPLRTQGGGVPAGDAQRRRAATPMLGQRTGGALAAPMAPASVTAPLLPGVLPPGRSLAAVQALAAPLLAGASAISPLLHPVPPVRSPFPLVPPPDPTDPLGKVNGPPSRATQVGNGTVGVDGPLIGIPRSPRAAAPGPTPAPGPGTPR
ncbi:zf-HC2 domain-containing protein [Streptomyces sp. NPDC049906]|uniref:anti-sigma factor family protein n=1 Tax=Streptomyces sp. NPDC049906 TaxID=3155656 RepID=UPI0034274D94